MSKTEIKSLISMIVFIAIALVIELFAGFESTIIYCFGMIYYQNEKK